MGFYCGVERFRNATVGRDAVLTSREYAAAFGLAMRMVLDDDGCSGSSPRAENGAPSPPRDGLVRALLRRVRRCPTDPTAHRLLGAALLDAGSTRAGVRHLGIALRLLLADADARSSLHGWLCARFEIGLVLIPLISMAARSGRPEFLRRVIGLLP